MGHSWKFWTEEDDAAVITGRAEGLNNIQIGEKLGRTQAAVGLRVCILRRRGINIEGSMAEASRLSGGADKVKRNPTHNRDCLSCGRAFKSEGAHNRMCTRCRHQSVSPFAPGPISRRNYDY